MLLGMQLIQQSSKPFLLKIHVKESLRRFLCHHPTIMIVCGKKLTQISLVMLLGDHQSLMIFHFKGVGIRVQLELLVGIRKICAHRRRKFQHVL